MDLLGFEFAADHIGMWVSGAYIDLHNNYVLRSHERAEQQLRIFWGRLDEPWVSPDQPPNVALEFAGVSYFEVRGELSDSLDEIGFFDNDTQGRVDYNGFSSPREGYDVLVLRFVGGGEIAVRAESAVVNTVFA